MKHKKGFSLIELVLTVALVGLVLQVVYSLFFIGATSYSVSTNKGFAQQDIRIATDFLEAELRYATKISNVSSEFDSYDYYSLEIENVDGTMHLVKTYHEYTGLKDMGGNTIYEETEIRRVLGNWNSVLITILENEEDVDGEVLISMEQTETQGWKDSGYALDRIVRTVNSNTLLSEGLTELAIKLTEEQPVYYWNSSYSLLYRGIDINSDIIESPSEGYLKTIFFYDGELYYDKVTGYVGSVLELPVPPTNNDKTFKGWYEIGASTPFIEFWDTSITVGENDLHLYADWTDSKVPRVLIGNYVIVDDNVNLVLVDYDKEIHHRLVRATVYGTETAIGDDGILKFGINGNEATVIVETSGYPRDEKVFVFTAE